MKRLSRWVYVFSLVLAALVGIEFQTQVHAGPLNCEVIPPGQNTICEGQSVVFVAVASDTLAAEGPLSYKWFGPNGFTADTQSITVSVAGTYTALVSVIGNEADETFICSSDLIVLTKPSLSVTGGGTICEGESVTLTATTDGQSILWSTGETTTSITVSPTTTTTYTVTVSSPDKCPATASVTVTVNPKPTVSVNNATICEGEHAVLTATGTSGVTYLWSNGATTQSINVTPTTTTTYSVTVTTAAGCTATATGTVTVNPKPFVAVNSGAMCVGGSVTLTAVATPGVSFLWSNGATTPSITVSPAASTTYVVTVRTPQGCPAQAIAPVIVNPLPTVDISGCHDVCAGDTVTLTAVGDGPYLWSNGATTQSITVSPSVDTTYTVTVGGAATTAPCPSGLPVAVSFKAPTGQPGSIGEPSYFDITVSGGTFLSGTYDGWCVDTDNFIDNHMLYNATAYCSYDTTIPAWVVEFPQNFPQVNYIINQHYAGKLAGDGKPFTYADIQKAIWTLLEDNPTGGTGPISPSPAHVTQIVNEANANGANFKPACGQLVAIVLAPETADAQVVIIDYPLTCCSASANCTIKVNPLPIVSVNDATICAGNGPVTLTATVSGAAVGPFTYLWSDGSTSDHISVNPSVTTTYSVTVTGLAGCKGVASGTVSVSTGQIGDFVWNDLNGNGCQDANEPGIPGVKVDLYSGCGPNAVLIKSIVTDSYGKYVFTGLCAGDYSIGFNTPAGYLHTLAKQACAVGNKPSNETDSDCECTGSGNCRVCVTLPTSDTVNLTIDCGYYQPVTVGNFVWNDLNGNGVQDAGEPGIPGVTLTLTGLTGGGAPVTETTTTDANGYYQFTEAPGTYTVAVTNPAGYVPTVTGQGTTATDSNASPSGTTPGTLPGGSSDQTLDFGFYQPVTIGNFVWNDINGNGVQDAGEPGIPGVTLTINGTTGSGAPISQTTTTDANGNYQFTEPPGSYCVTVTPPAGYSASPTGQGTTATDSNTNPGCTTPPFLAGGSSDQTVDFGFTMPVTIGNFVWNDLNGNGIQDAGEPGIPGVTLTLTGASGSGASITQTTTTDANGLYQFTEPPGTYTVAVTTPSGYVPTATGQGTAATDSNPTPSGTTPVTLAGGGSDQTLDFGFYQPVTIGNFVWSDLNANGVQDAGEPGIPGVTLTLTGTTGLGASVTQTTTTDANGLYQFTEPPGTYSVAVTAPLGYLASPTGQGTAATDSNPNPSGTTPAALASGGSDQTLDFGFYQKPPKLELTKSADKTFVLPGGVVTYSYVVKNTGGVTIENVTVVDDNGTAGDTSDDIQVGQIISLAPGASQTFTMATSLPQDMCMIINSVETLVGKLYITDLGSSYQVTYVQKNVNDNRYGTGATAATGWSKAQSFSNLTGSDKAEFKFTDGNGAVVLDFFIDYISASSSFISGYGSLGPNGGDGSWVSGNKAYLLSWTTSLSDNLNTATFKTGYTVNSPPETSPLSGVSIPAGWNYDNSYTVVVSKSAFGAAGFGGVSVPAVHDSPPKIGSSNLISPTPCDTCIENIAVAKGTAAGNPISAQSSATVCFGTPPPPKIQLTKTADRPTIPAEGGDVTYTYLVENTGGATVTDITVVDDNGTPDDTSDDVVIGTIPSLAPLESATLTYTFFVAPQLNPVTMCMDINGVSTVVGKLYITDLGSSIKVKYVQVAVNDNRYGTGANSSTGWPKGQSFSNLTGSDKAEFKFKDGNGVVVLDFFIDYISASSSFISGYGSLGPNGGDGSWVTGNKANLLSWTTSLSDNLNTATFKSGYNVNSPPETAPLSGVSVPAGWDYDNSYTVVVSKAAFGAAGFGEVTVPAVHDSPPKIGSNNLITPAPCASCVVNVATATGHAGTTTVSDQDTAQVCVDSSTTTCPATTSSIGSGFNSTSISVNNYLWFTANFTAKVPAAGANITFKNSKIVITSANGNFTYTTPDGKIAFSPSATCASTLFDGTQWVTTVPINAGDEILLSALGIKAPADLKSAKVTWTADFTSDVPGLAISWKWGAAVYKTDMTQANYNALGVKPTHANACAYVNSDHAGTPEAVKTLVTGGARGGGGSNYTGSWSSTAKPILCQ